MNRYHEIDNVAAASPQVSDPVLDQAHERIRYLHYSHQTEKASVYRCNAFVLLATRAAPTGAPTLLLVNQRVPNDPHKAKKQAPAGHRRGAYFFGTTSSVVRRVDPQADSVAILLVLLHGQAGHFIAVHGDGGAVLFMQLLTGRHDDRMAKGVFFGHLAVLVDVQRGAALQCDELFAFSARSGGGGHGRVGHEAGCGQGGGYEDRLGKCRHDVSPFGCAQVFARNED